MAILSITIFCSIILGGCPLMSKMDLKKMRSWFLRLLDGLQYQDTFDQMVRQQILVVGSSFSGVECTNTVERYDLEQKKKVKNDCPDMVSQYDGSMGRVYLADMLIALYRTNHQRWYLRLIFHCVDIAKVNAWLLYRRHFQQKEVGKKLQMNVRTFTTQIASAFAPAGKDPKKNFGRPKRSIFVKPPMGRNPAVQSPVLDIRCDKK